MKINDADIRALIEQSQVGFSIHAAAGSGKTTTVVRRIVERLTAPEHALPPRAVAAITYTRAAAAELRQRIHESLRELSEDPSDVGRAARASDALACVQEAQISTIHGLATDIIRSYAALIDLPPEIEVADETTQISIREARWKQVLARLLSTSELRSMFECAYELGLTDRDFTLMARSISDIAGYERLSVEDARAPSDLRSVVDSSLSKAFEGIAGTCLELEASIAGGPSELLVLQRIREDAAFWKKHREHPLPTLLASAYTRAKRFSATGKKSEWERLWPAGSARKDELLDRRKAAYGDLHAALATVRAGVVGTVGETMRQAIAEDARERRAAGFITYDEQISIAAEILGHPECDAADDLREIVVDEVQDTDPHAVQFLLVLVERARAAAERCGEKAEFVIVGDRRQSIYGFRGADPTATDVLAPLAGNSAELSSNFRSRPDLLRWIAGVFASIAPDANPPFGSMQAVRESAVTGEEAVQVLNGVASSAAAVRVGESVAVADAIVRLIDRNQFVEVNGVTRPAEFGDVAVLVRNRGGLAQLLAAFAERSIPAFVESGTLRYEGEEGDELIAMLEGIAQPHSLNHVIAALRVPPFACSDFEIVSCLPELKALLSRDVAVGDAYDAVPTDKTSVPRPIAAVQAMQVLGARWGDLPAIEAIRGVLDETGLLSIAERRRTSREHLTAVQFLIDEAMQAVASNPISARPTGLGGVASWLRSQRTNAARVADIPSAAKRNAVRISTMHGSKGLEYPIVIVCGLGGSGAPSSARAIASGPTIAVRGSAEPAGAFATSTFSAFADNAKARASEEELRLAYVAMTRAREGLVVSTWRRQLGPNAKGTLAHQIAEYLDDGTDLREPETPTRADGSAAERRSSDEALPRSGSVAALALDGAAPNADERRVGVATPMTWLAESPPDGATISDVLLPPRIGPSRLVHHEISHPNASDLFESDRLFGLVIHRCFELGLLQPSDDELDRMISATVGARLLDEDGKAEAARLLTPRRRNELRKCLEAAFNSPTFGALMDSGTCHHEIGVQSDLGKVRIRGTIDLLIERPDGLAIFDYKTDPFDPTKPGVLEARYESQLGAYVLAIEAAQSRTVAACGLLVVNPSVCELLMVDVGRARVAASNAIRVRLASDQ